MPRRREHDIHRRGRTTNGTSDGWHSRSDVETPDNAWPMNKASSKRSRRCEQGGSTHSTPPVTVGMSKCAWPQVLKVGAREPSDATKNGRVDANRRRRISGTRAETNVVIERSDHSV